MCDRSFRFPAARADRSDALVLFGATGDLAKKKIFPAVYRMAEAGTLGDVPVIGVASSTWTEDDLRQRAREAIDAKFSDIDEGVWSDLSKRIHYVAGDYREGGIYADLADALGSAPRPSSTWPSHHRSSTTSPRDSARSGSMRTAGS